MSLRFASPDDILAMERLHAQAFDAPWSAADIERLMRIMGGYALLAGQDAVEGFILARTMADEAEILTLAVIPGARRRGLGRALVEAAAAEARWRGAKALFLEVAADNPGALTLYEAAGFSQAGLRRAYYARPGAPAADAMVLRRSLAPPA